MDEPKAISGPELIYADDDILVVNKPAGMPVHEAKHSTDPTLVGWLLERFPEMKDVGDMHPDSARGGPYRPGIVHRLDKQTSGVMVVARNQASFLRLKELFKERRVEKTYLALVCGVMKTRSGVISVPLGRLKKSPTKIGLEGARGGVKRAKEAVTAYRVLAQFKNAALLEVRPKTGRMHQIRVHLASIGHPVAGDAVYGGARACFRGLGRYFLHAATLSFVLRDGQILSFSADLPPQLTEELKNLRT